MKTINRFKRIDVYDAVPGMILSDAIEERTGHIQAQAGGTITDAMLAAQRSLTEERLKRLFRRSSGDAAAQMLLKHVKDFRLGETAWLA